MTIYIGRTTKMNVKYRNSNVEMTLTVAIQLDGL